MSDLDGNHEDKFSRDTAHLLYFLLSKCPVPETLESMEGQGGMLIATCIC